jgi:hypothetical protein
VDQALSVPPKRALRWFDDYEAAFDTRSDAEACLKRLKKELGTFRLRLNPTKTKIMKLPRPAEEEWQELLIQTGGARANSIRGMVRHFDTAFRQRDGNSGSPVLLYALGVLFSLRCPEPEVGRIAQSCLTQAILCEPGAAQKAFALLSYWHLNGFSIDGDLVNSTINQLILRHEASGLSSDVAWALAFCLEQGLELNTKAGKILSTFDDDCIALQALHLNSGSHTKGVQHGWSLQATKKLRFGQGALANRIRGGSAWLSSGQRTCCQEQPVVFRSSRAQSLVLSYESSQLCKYSSSRRSPRVGGSKVDGSVS